MELDWYFKTEEEFERIVKSVYGETSRTEEDIWHEKDHYYKAKELGYTPSYALIDCNPTVLLEEEKEGSIKPEHIIKIALAPKNPSDSDKEKAFKAWKKIQEKRLAG